MSKSLKVLFVSAIFALGFGVAACGGDDGNGNGGGTSTAGAACQNIEEQCSGDVSFSISFQSIEQCKTAFNNSDQGWWSAPQCVADASSCTEISQCGTSGPDAGPDTN